MRQRPRSAILPATLAAALTSACGAAAPPPSEPVAPAEPGPAPVADGREPAPDPTPPPDPEPTLVGEPVVPPSKAPDPNAPAEQACSIWSGGPRGDAPPPKGYNPNPCGPNMRCECMSQAGYSCGGTCKPK
ncbi:MAG TPA: hypothetical protein PKA88_25410 [Polyangiaceae bacterium]|nr:hypothetical protein [Polyangiaceae bacterium]HMR78179.1 hypothetical protein [Polyangiaceae bacterium]